MAEGFEPFHVPQQSRRDKLRVVQNHSSCEPPPPATHHGFAGLLPLYDPPLFSSQILTCANPLGGARGEDCNHSPVSVFSVVNTASSSSSSHYHPYLDPQSSLAANVNPSSIQAIIDNPFPWTAKNLEDFGQSFNGEQVVTFKPEPLSLTHDTTTTERGLSLSLSSHHTQQHNLPPELSLPRYKSAMFDEKDIGGYAVRGIVGGGASKSNLVSRSSVPFEPFMGYPSILKGSRFLKPTQKLLEEFCDVGRGIYVGISSGDSSLMDPLIDSLNGAPVVDDPLTCSDHGEHWRKKTRLIPMLDEVYRRYKQYYQQMKAVVASFESVAGLGNSASCTLFALKAMSKHFRCFKNTITEQLHFTRKDPAEGNFSKDEAPRFGITDRGLHSQRPPHNSGILKHQYVWRPQRGLPEHAIAVLKAWLFGHFLHPYPTDTDKQMLAKQTGLSRNQVSNWFINARVRLWKPMVEEIHMIKTRQAQ